MHVSKFYEISILQGTVLKYNHHNWRHFKIQDYDNNE